MDLFGLYVGIVEKNGDPEKLGRLKVRVPHIYGILGGAAGAVPVDDLPWAIPLGLPAGGSPLSGGMDWLPEPGDQVSVQFLDGEPEKPVWSWLMQTKDQASTFKLHQYEETLGKVGKPKRGALTRYGHTVEWNLGSITMSTSKGYQVFLLDADDLTGQIMLRTPKAQFLVIDDETNDAKLFALDDFYINLGSELNVLCADVFIETVTGDFTAVLGNNFDVTALGSVSLSSGLDTDISSTAKMTLTSSLETTVKSGTTTTLDYGTLLQLGLGATEPFVLGNQLVQFCTTLLTWLATHVHTSTTIGTPTSPPTVPPVGIVLPLPAQLISSTIRGK